MRTERARTEGARLLELARAEARTGSQEEAWRLCLAAAAAARADDDAELLAAAATTLTEPTVGWRGTAARQALCLEALGRLGPEPTGPRERVQNQLDALSTGWAARPGPVGERIEPAEAESRFAELQAAYQRAIGPAGLATRLELAAAALQLGRAAGDDRALAWGWHWRADALVQLGLRVELNQAVGEFAAVVERLDSPVWTWRLACARAVFALLEDRLEDVPRLADAAVAAGRRAGAGDAELFDLILRGEYAKRTGNGLAEVEAAVRELVAEGPFFAQGWRAELLLALGRTDEAVAIQRALVPYLDEIPDDVHEWLIVHETVATLSIAAGDRESAGRARATLSPYAHLHLAGPITTAYGGPVALTLARLCAFLADQPAAERYAVDAARRADAMGAPWFAASARALQASVSAERAALAPLSPRETAVARLVAEAKTNREVAAELYLSERTVEQHVRSILAKLNLPNRSAVAAWVVKRT